MKKYILTSLMSLLLIAGTSIMLTATETERKEKASTCCSSNVKTAEATQTAAAKSGCEETAKAAACAGKTAESACCASKETKADAQTEEVKVLQTSTSSAAAAGCTGTSAVKASGPQPGECTKVPSGIRSQQASKEN